MFDASNPYRVPKREIPVKVRLSTGRQLAGMIYCSQRSDSHHGRERVKDVLNGVGAFLPLWTGQGAPTLLNRSFIEMVELEEEDLASPEDSNIDLARHREVSMLLSSGVRMSGTISISGPPGQDRSLDFLNRGERFAYLVCEEGTRIINLEHVVLVDEIED